MKSLIIAVSLLASTAAFAAPQHHHHVIVRHHHYRVRAVESITNPHIPGMFGSDSILNMSVGMGAQDRFINPLTPDSLPPQ